MSVIEVRRCSSQAGASLYRFGRKAPRGSSGWQGTSSNFSRAAASASGEASSAQAKSRRGHAVPLSGINRERSSGERGMSFGSVSSDDEEGLPKACSFLHLTSPHLSHSARSTHGNACIRTSHWASMSNYDDIQWPLPCRTGPCTRTLKARTSHAAEGSDTPRRRSRCSLHMNSKCFDRSGMPL